MEIHLPGNDTSVAEDLKNKKKRRVTESPVIEKIEKAKVELTMKELMKVSPQLRNMWKKKIAGIKTEYEPVEEEMDVNAIEDEQSSEESEEEQQKSSAYATCTIERNTIQHNH